MSQKNLRNLEGTIVVATIAFGFIDVLHCFDESTEFLFGGLVQIQSSSSQVQWSTHSHTHYPADQSAEEV